MSLYKINPSILTDLYVTDLKIMSLINLMHQRPLDRLESETLATCERKMKFAAKTYTTEWKAFQQAKHEQLQNGERSPV